MRYQVPQFTDIEDKIIGPLTLKQFLMYLFAALVLIPVYLSTDLSLFVTMAIPVAAVAAGFAHAKVNGKSLFTIIASGAKFVSRGKMFIWQRLPKPKLLRVAGDDYDELVAEQQATALESALTEQSRNINAGGRIVTEDITDPFSE